MLSATPTAAKTGAAKQSKEQSESRPWNLLAKWIDEDPRSMAVKEILTTRDPFLPVPKPVVAKPEPEKTAAAKAAAAKAAAAITPESLGLALSSTLIGPHRRTALINGKAYEQGRAIQITKDGKRYEFTLVEVHPRRIVLKQEGNRYELTIPQSTASGRLELYGRSQ